MDAVFEFLDRVMTSLRRRYPRAMLATSLGIWAAGTIALLVLFYPVTSAVGLAAYVLPPATLVLAVARWGLGRVIWPVWPIGVAPAVWIAIGFGFLANTSSQPLDAWVTALMAFANAQAFLGLASSVDHLRRLRSGDEWPVSEARTARRRLLQTKILTATAIALMLPGGGRFDATEGGFEAVHVLSTLGVGLLALLAAWFRTRLRAWLAAAAIPAVYLLNLLPLNSAGRWANVQVFGWVVLIAGWLWAKAATAWYWPGRDAVRGSPFRPRGPRTQPEGTPAR
jgi:hypothetical protein